MNYLNTQNKNPIKILKIEDNKWEFLFPENYYEDELKYELEYAKELLIKNDKEAEKRFKSIIKKLPFHIDAYTHLSIAYRNQGKTLESLVFAEKSFNLATENFPDSINLKTDEIKWWELKNRPFLLSCYIFANELEYNDKYYDAIQIYKFLFNFNKSDNLGARYPLFEYYLNNAKYSLARKILIDFKEDLTIDFIYGKVLLDIFQDKIDSNLKNLKKAVNENDFFYYEIIKPYYLNLKNYKSFENKILKLQYVNKSAYEAFNYWIRFKHIYALKKVKEYFINNKLE